MDIFFIPQTRARAGQPCGFIPRVVYCSCSLDCARTMSIWMVPGYGPDLN